jgi:hypothetical protein
VPHRIGFVALREAVSAALVCSSFVDRPKHRGKRIRVDWDQHIARDSTAGKNIGSNGPLLNPTPAIQSSPRECVFMPEAV